MKQFYLSLSLIGALTLQAAPPVPKAYLGQKTEAGKSQLSLESTLSRAPMRMSIDDLFACPDNTVLDGPYIDSEVRYSGFYTSDQGRSDVPSRFMQAFHGCYYSVNAVRVIGLFNYFDETEFQWNPCDSRGGMQEDFTLAEPVTFEVAFYRQTPEGLPGECVYQNNFDIIGRYLGMSYDDCPLYEFTANLGEDIFLESGFMSFSAADTGEQPSCWFAVFTADSSIDYAIQMQGESGMLYADMPCIFSLMGSGEPVAQKALRVDRMSSPVAGANGTHEKVTVKLINVGAEPIDDAILELIVDGNVMAVEPIPTTIAPRGACNYTFLHRIDLSTDGEHIVEVRNATPDDENVSLQIAQVKSYTSAGGEPCESSSYYPDEETFISHVKIGSIDNVSDFGSYTDYTDQCTTPISRGEILDLEVEPFGYFPIGVWVDWNNDGSFSGPGETIGYITDGPIKVSIPDGINLEEGMKRMRLVTDYWGNPTPCGNYFYGETEDYGLIVTRNADTPSIGVNLSEVAEEMRKGEKTDVALELSNTGDAELTAQFAIDYSLPTVYEPRKLAPVEKFGQKPVAAKVRANASEPTVDADVKNILRYDGGFDSSVAIDNYSSAIYAHYYPGDVIRALEGMTLSSIDIYINEAPSKVTVKVFGQGEPGKAGALVAEQPFEAVGGCWNHVALDHPVTITGEDLWFGIQIDEMESLGYIGIDALPAVAGYGDLCNIGGNIWWSLMELGIDHNLCIRGNVTGNVTPALNWLSLDANEMTLAAGENGTLNVTLNTQDIPAGTYEAAIKINSNDELKPAYSVPVYLSNGIATGIDNTSLDRTQVKVEDMNVVISSEHNILSVDAYDMGGRKVAADNNAGRRHEVSLDLFSKGTYVLNVTYTDGTREAFKIAVIR